MELTPQSRTLLDLALARNLDKLARETVEEVKALHAVLKQSNTLPAATAVRSLGNALSGEPDPGHRLLRLHEVVARHLDRADVKIPAPLVESVEIERLASPKFWTYVTGRLVGLRTGDETAPGRVELFWVDLHNGYSKQAWPNPMPADVVLYVHQCMAATFVGHLVETWEHRS